MPADPMDPYAPTDAYNVNGQRLADEPTEQSETPVDPRDKVYERVKNEDELMVAGSSYLSELLLENVRVLAIDQEAVQMPGSGDGQPARIGSTATLEVTPEQAKLLAWAGAGGSLTLSLRSLHDNVADDADAEGPDEALPKTRTSFAWPVEMLLAPPDEDMQNDPFFAEEEVDPTTLGVQMLRSGLSSRASSVGAVAPDNQGNGQEQVIGGGVNVQR